MKIVESMYDSTFSVVRSANIRSDPFEVSVGLHQGSALSPFLFLVVLDVLSGDVRKGLRDEILFADDVNIQSEYMAEGS